MLEEKSCSGCLEILSNDFEKNHYEIVEAIAPLSQKPSWNFLFYEASILYHKKKPNTRDIAFENLRNHKMYKVRCKICGKIYFMDETSFLCVKWQSCCGAECLKQTISDTVNNYDNIITVRNSLMSSFDQKQLDIINTVTSSLSYYGSGQYFDLGISYISDLHIDKCRRAGVSPMSMIRMICKRLYQHMNGSVIVFSGDTASDPEVVILFYNYFIHYKNFIVYQSEKKQFEELHSQKKTLEKINIKIEKLTKYIDLLIGQLQQYMDFNKLEKYRNSLCDFYSWQTIIERYMVLKKYKTKKYPKECDKLLILIALKLDLLNSFKQEYFSASLIYERSQEKLEINNSDILISQFHKKHYLLSEDKKIFIVLGNHEYSSFNSIKETVSFYKGELEPLGAYVLHNEYYEFSYCGNDFIFFGGTGFAKYNYKYNADSLVGCKYFTRDKEIQETTIFEEKYTEAKQKARDGNACFISISHYPIQDCLQFADCDVIYFYGHNHQNFFCRNETQTIYADNQVKIPSLNIRFETAYTNGETNPYFFLDDGLYKTSIKDYLRFYRYIGESIQGNGSLLYQRCQNNRACVYVIKRDGFYGFFLVNLNDGRSKGISIINGGKTRKITEKVDLQWLFNSFEVILKKYLSIIAPYRFIQEKISFELKMLGFSGSIHGCIVDIDFYHHIMLNPIDGTITYYFSPSFGMVQPLNSFDDVLRSIGKYEDTDICSIVDQSNYLMLKNQGLCFLQRSDIVNKSKSQMTFVGQNEGIYHISREISPLQRLFSGHVLRKFDICLVESIGEDDIDKLFENDSSDILLRLSDECMEKSDL